MRCTRLAQAAFRGSLHRHSHAELTWIERGHGLRWVGDSVEPFGDGDLVLLGSELAHVWLTQETGAATSCAATVLQFPVNWAAATGLPELLTLDGLMPRASHGLAVEGDARREVQTLMSRLANADAPRRVALLIETLALLCELQRAQSRDLRSLSVVAPDGGPDDEGQILRRQRTDRMLGWIHGHLAEPLRVADAARIVGVSPAAFARFFRREMGKSFIDFVNDARCSLAALQLLQGRASIAEIALACGFPTLSNFGDQFRRRYGVAPRTYRRQACGGDSSASSLRPRSSERA